MIKIEKVASPKTDLVYITRYMLWFTDRLCINVIKGDIEFMHTHPWDYFTLILWGGYKKTLIKNETEVTKQRLPGYFSFRKHDSYHRIQPIRSTAITLFYRSKNKTKNTKFLIDGKETNEIKYWYKQGVAKEKLKGLIKDFIS